MNKISLITLLIIVGALLVALGGGLGVWYKTQEVSPQLDQLEKTEAVIKALSSKTVPSIVAYGEVTNISNRDITLTFAGDSLTVSISANAQIYSFITPDTSEKGDTSTSLQQKVEFKDIKKGDNLNINVKLLPDGKIEGQSVIILPSVSNNASNTRQ